MTYSQSVKDVTAIMSVTSVGLCCLVFCDLNAGLCMTDTGVHTDIGG